MTRPITANPRGRLFGPASQGQPPPPSTVAAQIVEHHSANYGKFSSNNTTFRQLLDEIRKSPTAIETDPDGNYKLIVVIAEAGLDVSILKDPFRKRDDAREQILVCIEVIEIVLRRSPVVLMQNASRLHSDVLCWQLLSKMMSLVTFKEVRSAIQCSLCTISKTLSRSPNHWRDWYLFGEMLKLGSEDACALFASHSEPKPKSSVMELTYPSPTMLNFLNSQNVSLIAAPPGKRVKVLGDDHALHATVMLIQATCFLHQIHLRSTDNGARILRWALSKLSELWRRVMLTFHRQPVFAISQGTLATLLSSINTVIVKLHCVGTHLGAITAIPRTLTRCLADLINRPTLLLNRDIARTSAYTCVLLISAIKDSTIAKQAAMSSLRERVSRLLNENATTASFSKELRQILSILTKCLNRDSSLLYAIPRQLMKWTSALGVEAAIVKLLERIESYTHTDVSDNDERPPKKWKQNGEDSKNLGKDSVFPIQELGDLLRGWDAKVLERAAGIFMELNQKQRLRMFSLLGNTFCSQATAESPVSITNPTCATCFGSRISGKNTSSNIWSVDLERRLLEVLTTLVQAREAMKSTKLKVVAMHAMGQVASHTSLTDALDLNEGILGKLCLQGFRSPSKELRNASAKSLKPFLTHDTIVDAHLLCRNRATALNLLRSLSQASNPRIYETLVVAFGQVGLVCSEEELNLVLLQLVEYLGSSNDLLSGLAFLELETMAEGRRRSAQELLRPYWGTIAITAVKDYRKKPQKIQHIAELLGWSVNRLLYETQEYTVPYLVLSGQSEILERLAQTISQDFSVWDLCLRPNNLAALLAQLLIQHPTNGEAVASECLKTIRPELEDGAIIQMFKLDPAAIARELLLCAVQSEEEVKDKATQALKKLILLVERRGHSTRSSTTPARFMSLFCNNHALGIVNYLSFSIENPSQSPIEKKRAIAAIEHLVLIVQGDAAVTFPQIRACLQSAFDDSSLCIAAFSAWTAVLEVTEGESLEGFIRQTFTLIVEKWNAFDLSTQQKANGAIAGLLKKFGPLVQEMADTLPSLASIPLMSKFESQIARFRSESEISQKFASFSRRCSAENSLEVLQSLRELRPYLEHHQSWVHDSTLSEQPLPVIPGLVRSLLDTTNRFGPDQQRISALCAECLGIIGCLDPNRVETLKEANLPLIHSNFKQASEAVEFVSFILNHVLVKAFQSASNPRAQGFLAYVMQELLKFCGFNKDMVANYRPNGSQGDDIYRRWTEMPEATKQTLTPFLSSHYVLKANISNPMSGRSRPIYSTSISHSTWLRDFLLESFYNAKGANARMIFNVVARIVRGCDLAIVSLLLPYAVANIIIDGSEEEGLHVGKELLAVLEQPTSTLSAIESDHLKHCSEDVFQVLDYLSRWMQSKKKAVAATRNLIERSGRQFEEPEAEQEHADIAQISNVEAVLTRIPSDVISRRAAECGSYARAVLHWESYMRSKGSGTEGYSEDMCQQLQALYTKIDEPDGIEGISMSLQEHDPEQQAMDHRRAGRWTAAQSWYSLRIAENPNDEQAHLKMLSCLQEASQFTSVLQHIENIPRDIAERPAIQSIAAEAAWSTSNWNWLARNLHGEDTGQNAGFNPLLGVALNQLRAGKRDEFLSRLSIIRHELTRHLSGSTVSSLQSCQEHLFNLHVLYELELLSGAKDSCISAETSHRVLDGRLDVLGSSHSEKQYLLSLRRAVAEASDCIERYDAASSWMTTAKLARKGSNFSQAYNAVYHAAKLGDQYSKIEQARLLWNEGEHRRAIRSLEGAMGSSIFTSTSGAPPQSNVTASNMNAAASLNANNGQDGQAQPNMLIARAQLLMAKWLDQAGQTQSDVILQQYRQVTFTFQKWEKGLYNLGKFYNKLHESERAQPASRQGLRYLSGETAKLVIENYLRSLTFGCKYINETLPKLLTLWLDFGVEANRPVSREVANDIRDRATENRPKFLDNMNKQVKKYSEKVATFVFYAALAQMVTRISHENPSVWEVLAHVLHKVVSAHPQQALWALLATVKSSAQVRAKNGLSLLNRLKQTSSKTVRNEGVTVDLRSLVSSGQKLSEELLRTCEIAIQGRTTHVSLQKDLGFKMKVAPCPLVIPLEKTLTASLPVTHSGREMRMHKAFPMSREAITISSFDDNVLVLSSLQKPRKIIVKGSDGQRYGLLCKPNDDLRKDQRLMEFNAMINKALKKDAGASIRRLYIKTYAVTPLNEACGVIEWVEGLKPLRDILINLYRSKGLKIDYNLLRQMLTDACANPPESLKIFSHQLLETYYPVLHEWFTENFPAPDAWYTARTRYSRSCAVMSIVGYALGLGDRHGENVLLEEKNGGVFHVDFNCLFDKGLTFEKPELVPFRLTHNMVDAMGVTGLDGFFRRAAEATLSVMREQEDALLTILETFVYDPTADFMGTRQRAVRIVNVPGITGGVGRQQTIPETPREVLESVRRKLRGLLPGESLPLNVQGYVGALVAMAVDPYRLARMYIGWCAFL